jgi:hypothetical protein
LRSEQRKERALIGECFGGIQIRLAQRRGIRSLPSLSGPPTCTVTDTMSCNGSLALMKPDGSEEDEVFCPRRDGRERTRLISGSPAPVQCWERQERSRLRGFCFID